MSHGSGALLTVVMTALFICCSVLNSSGADDPIAQAAAQFREKDYAGAVRFARQASASPQQAFLLGVTLLRMGKAAEGLPFLVEAESRLPLVADYASLYQAEALLKLKKHPEAAAKAASLPKLHPTSLLIRRADKLFADVLYDAGDLTAALKAFQGFVEKYPSGADSVDALFQAARCREETGDRNGSLLIYRTIWLNNPSAAQALQAQERIRALEKSGTQSGAFTAEELLRRASTLATQNSYSSALRVLQSIPTVGQAAAVTDRIELREGMVHYRMRNWKEAEKSLTKAGGSSNPGIRSEARFWLAKSLERQDRNARSLEIYMELAEEGKKQEFADDALMEAAGLLRSQGKFSEAARLFQQLIKRHPDSKFISRALWESGWCFYLAGDNAAAADLFKSLLKNDTLREKAVYWLAKALDKSASPEADSYYRILLDEYPSGFYATWHREQRGIKDVREQLGQRNALAELPQIAGFEKPRLLALLGMMDESRNEMAAVRKKNGDKKSAFPGLARAYLEMNDYSSAIALFLQHRPVKWDTASLPLWTAGYPLVFSGPVSHYTTVNGLSEGLIYGLIRAESGFSPTIKSHAGAIGLMQLMPATAEATAREKGVFNSQKLVIPEYNIKLGTRHFRDLVDKYDGDVVYSIAAYNAGAAAVERWRKGLKGLQKDEFIESIPYQETRDYVKKVYASGAIYRQLYGIK